MNTDTVIASLLIASLVINAFIIRWQIRHGLAVFVYQGMRVMLTTPGGRATIAFSYAIQLILFSWFGLYLCLALTLLSPLYTLGAYIVTRRAYVHQLREAYGQ